MKLLETQDPQSIFIVIYFARHTSRETERSDRLSRSTKYIRSIYFKEVKYIDFFIFIRISEIDILDSSICAQKQLRMRMKLSLIYMVHYVSMMIFLTLTCCQHGMSSPVCYSPSYICMLYVKPSVLPRHWHVKYFTVNVIYFTFTYYDLKYTYFFHF